MDYGKFKYQEAKKAHEAKLKQKVIQVKEVKFRPGTHVRLVVLLFMETLQAWVLLVRRPLVSLYHAKVCRAP